MNDLKEPGLVMHVSPVESARRNAMVNDLHVDDVCIPGQVVTTATAKAGESESW